MERTAQCACGRVSITFSGEPDKVICCHCDYCQRRTGNVFQVSAWFPSDRVVKASGNPAVFNTSENSVGLNYNFCTTCGSTVHWTFDFRPGVIGVAVGCFVDRDFPAPEFECQTKYRHHWITPIEGAEQFSEFPP